MQIGSFGGNFDVAEVVLATFVLFFLFLVRYLQREANREHYPLVGDNGETLTDIGLFGVPSPKEFILPHGGVAYSPRVAPETAAAAPVITRDFTGGPFDPAGNKLLAGVGPGAFGDRADVPDARYPDGAPRIVPTRADAAYTVAAESPNPIGCNVVGADGVVAGTVSDVWVDRSESLARYLEISLLAGLGGRNVLVPTTMVDIQDGVVVVESILGSQFADVPGTKAPNQITLLEEDRISAYYAAGILYATPQRAEPLL